MTSRSAISSSKSAKLQPLGPRQRQLLREHAPRGFTPVLHKPHALAAQVGEALYALARSFASEAAPLTDVDVTPLPAGASPSQYSVQLYLRLGSGPWLRVDEEWRWPRAGGSEEAVQRRDMAWAVFASSLEHNLHARFKDDTTPRRRAEDKQSAPRFAARG